MKKKRFFDDEYMEHDDMYYENSRDEIEDEVEEFYEDSVKPYLEEYGDFDEEDDVDTDVDVMDYDDEGGEAMDEDEMDEDLDDEDFEEEEDLEDEDVEEEEEEEVLVGAGGLTPSEIEKLGRDFDNAVEEGMAQLESYQRGKDKGSSLFRIFLESI